MIGGHLNWRCVPLKCPCKSWVWYNYSCTDSSISVNCTLCCFSLRWYPCQKIFRCLFLKQHRGYTRENIYHCIPLNETFLKSGLFPTLFDQCSGASISRLLHPLYGHETCTKMSTFMSATQWYWVLFKGVEKKVKIKIYPPCFENEFFRKISLRGLQWYNSYYILPCIPLYSVGEKNAWKFSDGDTALIEDGFIIVY